jgi:hypothetical protein
MRWIIKTIKTTNIEKKNHKLIMRWIIKYIGDGLF